MGAEQGGASDEGIIGQGTVLVAHEFVVQTNGFLGLLQGLVEACLGEASLAGVDGAIGMGDDGLVGVEGFGAALFGVGTGGDAVQGDHAQNAAGRGEAIELGAGIGVLAGNEQLATGDEGGLIRGGSAGVTGSDGEELGGVDGVAFSAGGMEEEEVATGVFEAGRSVVAVDDGRADGDDDQGDAGEDGALVEFVPAQQV